LEEAIEQSLGKPIKFEHYWILVTSRYLELVL